MAKITSTRPITFDEAVAEMDRRRKVIEDLEAENKRNAAGFEYHGRRAEWERARAEAATDALEWALDTLDTNDEFLREQLPNSWDALDHLIDNAAKFKARAALMLARIPFPGTPTT